MKPAAPLTQTMGRRKRQGDRFKSINFGRCNPVTSGSSNTAGKDTSTHQAKFTSGSTMRHVVVMTSAASVGLVSVFFVDALNLFYISLLGQQELAAAIGYASTVLFFAVSISIGMAIAGSALVARAYGEDDIDKVRSLSGASLIYLLVATSSLAALLYVGRFWCLTLLGAEGETLEKAALFMQIVVPSIPLLGLGMIFGALLRSNGDARRAMYVTLGGAIAALFLDPLFIFGFDLGITGAAIATVATRLILVLIGWHGVHVVHKMVSRPDVAHLRAHLRPFLTIALPALATQLATPVGNAYVTSAIADFGDDAVAGWAIVGRLIPVAFGVVFALSGSVGPILAQNFGAGLLPRVLQAQKDALKFAFLFCVAVWLLLMLSRDGIIWTFGATGDAAALISTFCFLVAGSFIFTGAMFVSNAAFNNLGHPLQATAFNWGRATLGTFPFVYFGKAWGAEGVLIAWGLGGVIFGVLSSVAAFRMIRRLPDDEGGANRPGNSPPSTSNSPFTSGKGATAG